MPPSAHNDADLLALGRAIRLTREQRSVTVDDLAGATGISRQRIAALEIGRVEPTYETLLALAEGLGVQPYVLVALAERLKASREP